MNQNLPELAGRYRWRVAMIGIFLQLCLGSVYAWSYFQKPVMSAFGCSQSAAAWPFSLAICFLGIAAAWGGININRIGPTRLAVSGATLYSCGYLVAGAALKFNSIWLFYAGFGVIGGIGLGLGYVTPVATVAKWFPDKKGLVTGMVVMGFGFGAMLMSKIIAPILLACVHGNLSHTFIGIGILLFAAMLPAAAGLKNPPSTAVIQIERPNAATDAPTVGDQCERGISTAIFAKVWLMFFCNISAGIMFIGFQSPMLQELLKSRNGTLSPDQLAAAGATLIGISSIFNGIGRLIFGAGSDRLGRINTFRLILGTQLAVFAALVVVDSPWLFGLLVCYVLLCYGGGFGTMPSLALDLFGPRKMAMAYGALLTAWSAAGIAGPQVVAKLKDCFGPEAAAWTYGVGTAFLGLGLLASLLLKSERC